MSVLQAIALLTITVFLLALLAWLGEQVTAFESPVKPKPCVPLTADVCLEPILPTPAVQMGVAHDTFLPVVVSD
jgi:hypothetical protein